MHHWPLSAFYVLFVSSLPMFDQEDNFPRVHGTSPQFHTAGPARIAICTQFPFQLLHKRKKTNKMKLEEQLRLPFKNAFD